MITHNKAITGLFIAALAAFSFLSACNNDKPAEQPSGPVRDTTTMTDELRADMTAEQILQTFKDGNKRFLDGKMIHRDYASQVTQTSNGQHPYAIIVSCIDSRKPAEIIFDKGIGDVFNARIAGNFVNTDILGSIEFACKLVGAKVILVMGHNECGAIKGACDHAEMGNLTATLANILPAVNAVPGFENDRSSKNAAFVEAVAEKNVMLAKDKIMQNSPIIKEMVDKGEVVIAGCMYDITTGAVKFY